MADPEGPSEQGEGSKRRKLGGRKRNLRKQPREQSRGKHNLVGALNHRHRRQVLRLLIRSPKPLSPAKVSKQLDMPLSNVSYHMGILRQSDAAAVVEEKPVRGAVEHFYAPNVANNPAVLAMLDETEDEDEGKG